MPSAEAHDRAGEKARRREARKAIAAYHEEQLRLLLDHVREGLKQMDAGQISPFELDDLIHHYKQSARELWKFCNLSGDGPVSAARALEFLKEHGEEPPGWWAAGGHGHRRR